MRLLSSAEIAAVTGFTPEQLVQMAPLPKILADFDLLLLQPRFPLNVELMISSPDCKGHSKPC